jgi:hypothetical protein
MVRRIRTTPIVLAAVLLFLSACGGAGGRSPQPRERTTVTVENQAWLDMNVFALEGSSRHRLGTVTATSTRTFDIPAALVGTGRQLSFLADPIGSSTQATSYAMFVRPGDNVTLTIPATVRE